MANRGFPTGQPNDGKPGFPYQPMNGNYQGVYYPGQEMAMPYGQYGQNPATPDPQFSDQCAVQQNYGFVPQPYNVLQYRQQQAQQLMHAQAAQAAYCNTQQPGSRMNPNPQHIADSIYNMAAHAYNYQQQTQGSPMQQPAAQNPYSPGVAAANHTSLTVRTSGLSPANSIHSPAGSTHSMGERPMASPLVQSNTQMYNNYHQSNCQSQTQQQQCNQNMNYFNTNRNPNQPSNTAMTNEVDQRRSIERLATISHPTEQYVSNNPVENQNPVAQSNNLNPSNNSTYYNNTTSVPPENSKTAQVINKPAPCPSVSCENIQPDTQVTHITPVVSSSDSSSTTHHTIPESSQKSSYKVDSEPCASVQAPVACLSSTNVSSVTTDNDPAPVSKTETRISEAKPHKDLDQKHKETAADSGIDSEQVDTHPEEENDTSTTSYRSENSPLPPDKSSVTDTHEAASENSESLCNTSDKQSSVFSPRSEQGNCEEKEESIVEEKPSINDEKDTNVPPLTLMGESAGGFSPDADTLNDSFSSTNSASKHSNNDESRLPPRKRKLQQMSEHLSDDSNSVPPVTMPPKKRGRPTKEAVRLREAAKAAEAAIQSEPGLPNIGVDCKDEPPTKPEKMHKNVPQIPKVKPKKERKQSCTVLPEGISKPVVHSGVLLQTPKLSLEGMSSSMFKTEEQLVKVKEKKKSVGEMKMSTDYVHTKKPSLSPGSNAVRVSPPKKPKASVSEMQKALMRAVSNDNADVSTIGKKRKRGRPPGTKNRRTQFLEQRNRSNSMGSNSAWPKSSTSTVGEPFGLASSPLSQRLGTPTNDNTLTVATDSTYPQQSHEQTVSVQVPELPLKSRKSSSVSPKPNSVSSFELKLPITSDQWMCTFCHQITNYHDMGDLYGGYNVKPDAPVTLKTLNYKKASEIRQLTLDANGRAPNEVWFHEKCIVWSPGVYVTAGKLYGLYEALATAFQTTCSVCRKKGAILGCYCKGCPQRYHIHCAEGSDCLLNEENFSMFCPKHKEKKIKLV